ncbi:hypothetical protein BC830DRAFT_288368 [Chytriomyces sp. MP71]|nr:hypothetical protein BC830DRAFT_288368 [Chytriomyces sp. MP71]
MLKSRTPLKSRFSSALGNGALRADPKSVKPVKSVTVRAWKVATIGFWRDQRAFPLRTIRMSENYNLLPIPSLDGLSPAQELFPGRGCQKDRSRGSIVEAKMALRGFATHHDVNGVFDSMVETSIARKFLIWIEKAEAVTRPVGLNEDNMLEKVKATVDTRSGILCFNQGMRC